MKYLFHIKNSFEANTAKGINRVMHSTYGFIDEPIYHNSLLILNTIQGR